jgi:hypothetical protein
VDPVCALDCSVVISSLEAQAEIKNAIAKNKTVEIANRFIMGAKLTMNSVISQIASIACHGNRRTRLSSFDVASVGW